MASANGVERIPIDHARWRDAAGQNKQIITAGAAVADPARIFTSRVHCELTRTIQL